jgi:hypothetical protein
LSSETQEHRELKELLRQKLEEWFGISIDEYPSSGHELDVFSISKNRLTLMVEIIWTATELNFLRDLTILQTSDEQLKIPIVNPIILQNEKFRRMFLKVRISETKKGSIVSDLIDGRRLLQDPSYLNIEFKNKIFELINETNVSLQVQVEELKEKVLSAEPLSPIVSKCIDLARKSRSPEDKQKWLKNELYGYDITTAKNLPNNPDYRWISVRVALTMDSRLVGVDYTTFWGHSVSHLEELENDIQGDEVIAYMSLKSFPESAIAIIKEQNPNVQNMPVFLRKRELQNSLEKLRLRIHQFLDSIVSDREYRN